jgi:hypothetical protein
VQNPRAQPWNPGRGELEEQGRRDHGWIGARLGASAGRRRQAAEISKQRRREREKEISRARQGIVPAREGDKKRRQKKSAAEERRRLKMTTRAGKIRRGVLFYFLFFY